MIFLGGKQVKIVGGNFKENRIKVKRLFIGAETMVVNKELLTGDGGYLEIYKEIEKANNKKEE